MDLLRKLNFKDQEAVLVLNPPNELASVFENWSNYLKVNLEKPVEGSPFVLVFVRDKTGLEEVKPALASVMDPSGLVWVAYPKKTSKKYISDLSRDDFWEAFKELGLEPVRQVAIDENWSALRFRPGSEIKRKSR